jgi:uncharacterized membrane protein YqjE
MASLIVSTVILVATVAVLGGWAMRKERRLRERAETLHELEATLETQTREERDARDHRLSA